MTDPSEETKHTCIFNLEKPIFKMKLPKIKGTGANCSTESEEKQGGSTHVQDHSYSCLVNTSLRRGIKKMTFRQMKPVPTTK